MSRGESLLSFHKSCKEEYNELLKHFNILFYGYGCKVDILKYIFPDAIFINCRFCNYSDLIKEFIQNMKLNKKEMSLVSSIKKQESFDLNKLLKILKLDEKNLKIVILNIDFNFVKSLFKYKNLRIIGTAENILYDFTCSDIEDFNFIFRDLTTFIPYNEEVVDICFYESSKHVEGLANIYQNVSQKCKLVFLEVLKLKRKDLDIYLKDVFEKLKYKFLLKNKSEILTFLSEFIDHNIIKIKGDEKIKFDISNSDINKFMDGL